MNSTRCGNENVISQRGQFRSRDSSVGCLSVMTHLDHNQHKLRKISILPMRTGVIAVSVVGELWKTLRAGIRATTILLAKSS